MKIMCVMDCRLALNVAVTLLAAVIVMLQVLVPEQAPDHPAKVKPVAGAAVNVTVLPVLKFAVQVWPQLIPDGLLLTVPVPLPASETVRRACNGTGLPVNPTHPAKNKSPKIAKIAANHRTRPNMWEMRPLSAVLSMVSQQLRLVSLASV